MATAQSDDEQLLSEEPDNKLRSTGAIHKTSRQGKASQSVSGELGATAAAASNTTQNEMPSCWGVAKISKVTRQKTHTITMMAVEVVDLESDSGHGELIALEVDVKKWRVEEKRRTAVSDGVKMWMNAAYIQHGGELYIIGGLRGFTTQKSVCKYSRDRQWVTLPKLRRARSYAAAFSLHGRIFVTGGVGDTGKTTVTVEALDVSRPKRWWSRSKWRSLNDLPRLLWYHAVVAHNDSAYLSGGQRPGVTVTDVYKYEDASDTWSAAGHLSQPRRQHAMVSFKQHIYIIGGVDAANDRHGVLGLDIERYDPVLDIERYDPISKQSTKLASPRLPCPMRSATCAQDGQYVYFRGWDKLHCFDIVQKTVTTLEGKCPDFDYLMIL